MKPLGGPFNAGPWFSYLGLFEKGISPIWWWWLWVTFPITVAIWKLYGYITPKRTVMNLTPNGFLKQQNQQQLANPMFFLMTWDCQLQCYFQSLFWDWQNPIVLGIPITSPFFLGVATCRHCFLSPRFFPRRSWRTSVPTIWPGSSVKMAVKTRTISPVNWHSYGKTHHLHSYSMF